jgi:hypothetical protein
MKNETTDCEQPDGLPPVRWFIGDVVACKGKLKLEWNERAGKTAHYNEKQLAMRERSARNMLVHRHEAVEPVWDNAAHARWRDIHYNAEYGLQKLQLAKQVNHIDLDLPFRPVVPHH